MVFDFYFDGVTVKTGNTINSVKCVRALPLDSVHNEQHGYTVTNDSPVNVSKWQNEMRDFLMWIPLL